MPKKKGANRFRNLAKKRWENKNTETGNIIDEILGENEETVFESAMENNHENLDKNLDDTPVKTVRIQNKLDSLRGQVNIQSNECEYVIVDVSQLNNLLCKVKCADCNGTALTFDFGNERKGFVSKLILKCEDCKDLGFDNIKSETYTSKRITRAETSRPFFDINLHLATAFIYIGKGYAGVEQFSMFLNMILFAQSTFDDYIKYIENCLNKVTQNVLDECRSLARKSYEVNKDLLIECDSEALDSERKKDGFSDQDVNEEKRNEKEIVDCAVGYDGSWLTRGHKSKHGIGCAVDIETGFVLDFEVMTKYCQIWATTKSELSENSPEYNIWLEGHSKDCDVNHEGSSGAMEMAAAEKIWKRSEEYGFRFATMLSDGDSKTFNYLQSLHVYGKEFELEKEECINHVGKRLYTGLVNIVKEEKARKITLGGKGHGQLKISTIEKLAEYYKKAIYRNKSNIQGMKDAIFATIYHAVSTDKKPQHFKCPVGSASWCFFQAAIANNKPPGPHLENVHTPLNKLCFSKILPLYERLTDDTLMIRCSRCLTQNANESLHSTIWNKCPKEIFVSRSRVKIGASIAVCIYNVGNERTTTEIIKQTGLLEGQNTATISKKRDCKQIARSLEKMTEKHKNARREMALAQSRRERNILESEGTVYGAGVF